MASEYSFGEGHSQPDMTSNIRWTVLLIRRIVSEYSFGEGHGQPDRPSNIMWLVPSD
jgi:hypothetical protein